MDGKNAIHIFDETGETSNESYVYPIGSVTKTFVASLLAKFVHEGKMSLDDSISKYISGLDSGRYYPTLKRLAAHTSGYATRLGANAIMKIFVDEVKESFGIGGGYNPYNLSVEEMIRIVRKNLVADKDYKWNYSNFNYALLGYAIGVASGQGYWKTMDDFLLNDLGMSNSYTGIRQGNIPAYNWNNKNVGHWFETKDFAAPCGDISATAEDLLTYAKLNMNEEPPYLALCHQKYTESKTYDMGLAWHMIKGNNSMIFHTGQTSTPLTWLMISKEYKCAYVVLLNYGLDKEFVQLGNLLGEVLSKKIDGEHKNIAEDK